MKAAAIAMKRVGPVIQVLLIRSSSGKHWTLPKGHLHPYENEATAAARELEEEAGYKGQPYWDPVAWYVPQGKQEGVACVLVTHARHLSEGEPDRNPTWVALSRAKRLLSEDRTARDADSLAYVLEEALEAFLLKEARDEDPHS